MTPSTHPEAPDTQFVSPGRKGAAFRPSRGHDAAHHDVLLPSPVLLGLPEPLVRD